MWPFGGSGRKHQLSREVQEEISAWSGMLPLDPSMSMCSPCFLFPVIWCKKQKVFDCPGTSFIPGSRALAYFADKKNEDHDEEDCLKLKF